MSLVAPATVWKVSGESLAEVPDLLAVEEPLEIRLGFGPTSSREQRPVSVTMRTPGHDEELAMGFLFTEGIIQKPTDLISCRHCVQDSEKEGNVLRVELHPDVVVDWSRLERNTFTSSSCGLCGKATIESVMALTPGPIQSDFRLEPTFFVRCRNVFVRPSALLPTREVFMQPRSSTRLANYCWFAKTLVATMP